MDALAILIALKLQGHAVRPLRVLCGAALGAAIAGLCTCLLPNRAAQIMLWPPAAMSMMLLADGEARAHPFAGMAVLLAAYGLLGGTVQALAGATGSLPAAWLLGAGFSLAAAVCVRRRRRMPGRGRLILTAGGKTAEWEAIIDSGNTLTDYLTRLPVIVLAQEDAQALLDPDALHLRPLFADTAGGRQMMWCFTPERALLRTERGTRELHAAAALSPGLRRGSPALIPGVCAED